MNDTTNHNDLTIIPAVFERGGSVYADSRDVAAYFGKRHDNVLRDIDNLLKTNNPQNWQGGWFSERITPRPADNPGKPFRHFELTKDGFILLAMGFTGEKALPVKIAYIEQFNAMEAEIVRRAAVLRDIADIQRQLSELRAASSEIHASNADLRMQLAEIRVNPYARLTVDMMTACEVRNAHVADRKHGPKPAAISAKLTAWISRRGNLGNVHRTAERDGAKRLFQRGDVYEWLKHEGDRWIRSVVDGRRGQQSLRLVPLPQPQPTV